VGKFADRLEPRARRAKLVLSDMRVEGVQAVVDEITAAGGCVLVPFGLLLLARSPDFAPPRRQATCVACDVTSWEAQVAMFVRRLSRLLTRSRQR